MSNSFDRGLIVQQPVGQLSRLIGLIVSENCVGRACTTSSAQHGGQGKFMENDTQ